MERVCSLIATKLSVELELDDEKRYVIQYGIFAIVQVIITIFVLMCGGILLGVTYESLILMITSSALRRYSGGAHASTPLRCLVIGTSVCLTQALLVNSLGNVLQSDMIIFFIGILIYLASYYMIYKYVPVDNIKKPIRSEAKKKRMKESTKKIINFYFLIALLILLVTKNCTNNYHRYVFCIYFGVVWQLFTITEIGHKVIYRIDNWFEFFRKEINYEKDE